VVGPTRRAALALALALRPAVDVLVLDGPLQLAPARSSLSVLALDAAAPWGSGALPPAGDLRAPREALLSAADVVVAVEATPRAASLDGETVALGSLLRAGPLGLFTALARPERLERALASAGIVPAAVVRAADHGPVTRAQARRLGEAPVALWLATDKCALHLDALRLGLRLRVARLDGGLALPPALLEALARAWDTPPHRLP
jgi:tetraacyldisaccharide 4'-kinase